MNSEGNDQPHYTGKPLHRHEKNTGFCFCQFIKKNGDFWAISVKERKCAAVDLDKWIIIYRIGFCKSHSWFLPLFVAVWTGFQVKWVGASMGWDPLIWKYIFRGEDCDLVRQTGFSANRPLRCNVRCVWTTCSSSIRIHFHVDTKIYFEYSAVDRPKK